MVISIAVGFGVAGDAILDLWDLWDKQTPDQQDKMAEVQLLAGQSAAETRQLAQQLTKEEADNQPEAVREAIASYLTQGPAMATALAWPDSVKGASSSAASPSRSATLSLP